MSPSLQHELLKKLNDEREEKRRLRIENEALRLRLTKALDVGNPYDMFNVKRGAY